jgi:glutathione S-transferase
VIQEYLEERYPRPSFRGDDAEATARIRLLGRIADLYLVPALLPLRTVVGTTERSEAAVASAAEDLGRVCALLDGYLDAGDPYAVGSRLSLADCALAPLVLYARHFARTLGVDSGLASAPRLARWFESVQADPHVAPVLEQIRAALREVS